MIDFRIEYYFNKIDDLEGRNFLLEEPIGEPDVRAHDLLNFLGELVVVLDGQDLLAYAPNLATLEPADGKIMGSAIATGFSDKISSSSALLLEGLGERDTTVMPKYDLRGRLIARVLHC